MRIPNTVRECHGIRTEKNRQAGMFTRRVMFETWPGCTEYKYGSQFGRILTSPFRRSKDLTQVLGTKQDLQITTKATVLPGPDKHSRPHAPKTTAIFEAFTATYQKICHLATLEGQVKRSSGAHAQKNDLLELASRQWQPIQEEVLGVPPGGEDVAVQPGGGGLPVGRQRTHRVIPA